MKNKYLFLIFATMLLATSCRRSGTDIWPTGEVRSAFNFREGSYWIYQDTVSGVFDSFYVSKYREYMHVTTASRYQPNNETREHIVEITITESPNSFATGDSVERSWQLKLTVNQAIINYFEKKLPANDLIGPRNFNYPVLQYPLVNTAKVPVLPSYNVSGNTYQNIALVNVSPLNMYTYPIRYHNLYVASGVGLIKISQQMLGDTTLHLDPSHRVLELRRYSIKN